MQDECAVCQAHAEPAAVASCSPPTPRTRTAPHFAAAHIQCAMLVAARLPLAALALCVLRSAAQGPQGSAAAPMSSAVRFPRERLASGKCSAMLLGL